MDLRKKHAEKQARQQAKDIARGKVLKVYYKCVPHCQHILHVGEAARVVPYCITAAAPRKDSQGRVSGGKDRASTAAYPAAFCTKLLNAWLPEFRRVSLSVQSVPAQLRDLRAPEVPEVDPSHPSDAPDAEHVD